MVISNLSISVYIDLVFKRNTKNTANVNDADSNEKNDSEYCNKVLASNTKNAAADTVNSQKTNKNCRFRGLNESLVLSIGIDPTLAAIPRYTLKNFILVLSVWFNRTTNINWRSLFKVFHSKQWIQNEKKKDFVFARRIFP